MNAVITIGSTDGSSISLRLLDELRDQLDRLVGRHPARHLSAPELGLVSLREPGLDLVQHRGLKVAREA